jgi:hypothetical protein
MTGAIAVEAANAREATGGLSHDPEPTPPDDPSEGPHHRPSRRLRSAEVLVAVQSVAFAVLVGVDGPAPWPIVRAAVVLVVGAACVGAQRRLGRRAAATAIVVFGLAGLIPGLGIGIGHLAEDPSSAEAIAGSVTVVGGLGLVGLGSVSVIRAAHRWWKLLALPIGFATLALVLMPLTLAVFVTNAPPFEATSATPEDHGLASEHVSLVTADGVGLDGRYIASSNGASVIVLGGISGISDHEVDIAAMLARHGYGVLLLNVRGQGESQGDAMQWGWWGEVDVSAGTDYLAKRPDVIDGRIGAIGMSVGGEQAISAAGVDTRLRAVVSEGASARGARDEGDAASGVSGVFIKYVDWVSRHAASLMTGADQPTPLRESLAGFDDQRALLIAAGTAHWEIGATEVLRAAAPEQVDVWIAPDAAHTGALETYPDEWERRVVDFLDDALQP